MNAGALAYANTRVRAARGRIIDAQARTRLKLADSPGARAAALIEIGLGDGTPLDAFRHLIARLGDDYQRVLRSVPGDQEPFLALRARHEIENLKLVLRALDRRHPAARWTPWWRPIGDLQLDDFRGVVTREEIPAYRELIRSLPKDLAAAELALDRFATRRIAEAHAEPDVAAILKAVVREREAAAERRVVRGRRRLCDRAFLLGPFSRAAAVALLMIEEDVMAEVIARAEAV